jgi:hypothetical protein
MEIFRRARTSRATKSPLTYFFRIKTLTLLIIHFALLITTYGFSQSLEVSNSNLLSQGPQSDPTESGGEWENPFML